MALEDPVWGGTRETILRNSSNLPSRTWIIGSYPRTDFNPGLPRVIESTPGLMVGY